MGQILIFMKSVTHILIPIHKTYSRKQSLRLKIQFILMIIIQIIAIWFAGFPILNEF